MTPLKYEFRSLMSVGVLTAGIALAFPLSAIRFEAERKPISSSAVASFVNLTLEQEVAALKAAKSAWQSDASARERMRVRLPLGELPEEEQALSLGANEILFPDGRAAAPLAYPLPAYAPSFAAPAPKRLPTEAPSTVVPAFSREELLRL